jgi:hypothetical protein
MRRRRAHRRGERGRIHRAPVRAGRDGPDLDPGECGQAGVLPLDQVRLAVEQHLGPAPREHPDRRLIGHGAAGKKNARSFRSSSATRASSRRTVGSPSSTSSPTSASAIARRMAAVGFVTVSLRRSMRAPLFVSGVLIRQR